MNFDKDNATLLFAGDFCSCPSTSYICAEELVDIVSHADLSIVNFEAPLLPLNHSLKAGKLYQNHDSVTFLKSLGFSIFNIANNHILDYSQSGAEETIKEIGTANCIGCEKNPDIKCFYTFNVNNIKIALVPVCYACDSTIVVEGYHCNMSSSALVKNYIQAAKKDADYVIVLPHDGIEYIPLPTLYIRNLYHEYIDWGASAVIATHTHCPQGIEFYHDAPICYSLGNLYFNSKSNLDFHSDKPKWYNGIMVKLTLNKFHGRIHIDYYFTFNDRNKQITLDKSEQTILYFKELCNILQNDIIYHNKLDTTSKYILESKYLPMTDSLFRIQIKRKKLKYLLKQIAAAILNKNCSTENFYSTMYSETERTFFLDSIKKFL